MVGKVTLGVTTFMVVYVLSSLIKIHQLKQVDRIFKRLDEPAERADPRLVAHFDQGNADTRDIIGRAVRKAWIGAGICAISLIVYLLHRAGA